MPDPTPTVLDGYTDPTRKIGQAITESRLEWHRRSAQLKQRLDTFDTATPKSGSIEERIAQIEARLDALEA